MDTFLSWEWRWLPSTILVAAGFALIVRGIWQSNRGAHMAMETLGKNLVWVRGFRGVIQGVCILGAGVGWWAGWPVMIAAAGVILLEETIEIGIASWALRQEYEIDRQRG